MFCQKCGSEITAEFDKCLNCGFTTALTTEKCCDNQSSPNLAQIGINVPAAEKRKKKSKNVKKMVICAVGFAVVFLIVGARLFLLFHLNEYSFHISQSKAVIISYFGHGGNVTIPDKLFGFPVKEIKGTGNEFIYVGAFSDNSEINSVIIGDNIELIGEWTFSNCRNLTSVVIPEGVKTIKNGAFSECPNLKDVTIPKSVMNIAPDAFSKTMWLNEIPGDYVVAGDDMLFSYKGNTADISIPSNVKRICDEVFKGNLTLENMIIPDCVISIGDSVFQYCSRLESVKIGNGLSNICYSAFEDCVKLTTVILPDSLSSIDTLAFSLCSSLGEIVIPENVKSIGDYAFYDCLSLKSVVIPDNTEVIGEYAFGYMSDMESKETLLPGFKIYCSVNSAAQKYAQENGIEYEIVA